MTALLGIATLRRIPALLILQRPTFGYRVFGKTVSLPVALRYQYSNIDELFATQVVTLSRISSHHRPPTNGFGIIVLAF